MELTAGAESVAYGRGTWAGRLAGVGVGGDAIRSVYAAPMLLDEPEFARWHAAAVEAIDIARAQIGLDAYHWSCFLAEQGAQFAVKGLLHGLGVGAWGHDLAELARRLETALTEQITADVTDAMLRLSRHYNATRYPDAHPAGTPSAHYSASDAQQAVEDARRVLDFVGARWSSLLTAADEASHGD
ncbi:MAG: HEPN domain-containing protein [Actinomycetota bacterium]|nr:HEPN domain-containing protein [Actinomycetota bacterium]